MKFYRKYQSNGQSITGCSVQRLNKGSNMSRETYNGRQVKVLSKLREIMNRMKRNKYYSLSSSQVQLVSLIIFSLFVTTLLTGCSGKLVPARTLIRDYSINTPNQKVFDAVFAVAQSRNLDVAVLEKQSGLVRFVAVALTPIQLETYCEYPYVRSDGSTPWDTFVNWDQRSQRANAGPVMGRVSLTLLISSKDSLTNINMRGNWFAYNKTENTPCTSRGTFEREFISDVRNEVNKIGSSSNIVQLPLVDQPSSLDTDKAVVSTDAQSKQKPPQSNLIQPSTAASISNPIDESVKKEPTISKTTPLQERPVTKASTQLPSNIGNWLIKKSTDPMTDKVTCTAFYHRDSQVQLTASQFFIGLSGRGGVRGRILRFGDNPAHPLRLPTEMEKRISTLIFSPSEFAELQNSRRLRVQVITVLDRVWDNDIDLTGHLEALDVLRSPLCN